MKMNVSQILRDSLPANKSMSLSRRMASIGKVTIDGNVVQLFDEVEVKEGSTLRIGNFEWMLFQGEWKRNPTIDPERLKALEELSAQAQEMGMY